MSRSSIEDHQESLVTATNDEVDEFSPHSSDDDENDPFLSKLHFQSIRNSDGLEEAIQVQWENRMNAPLHLSTLLQPDDLAPLFAGAQWAGTRVWHAALAAIDYLVSQQEQSRDVVLVSKETRILELGCGLGVPGMILHALYGSRVCLTDQESILSQLEHNLRHNFPNAHRDSKRSTIQARALSWSKQGIQELLREETFDIVLNCDCIYEPLYGKSWTLLVEVLEEVLRQNPKTLVLTSVERRNADGIDDFLSSLQASPHVSSIERVMHQPEYKIEIYLAHGVIPK